MQFYCKRREFLKLGGTLFSYPLTRHMFYSVLVSESLSSSISHAANTCGPFTVDTTLFTIDSTLIHVSNIVLTRDSDCDGLSNRQEERRYGTDPQIADSDGDGLTDGEEISVYGTDPLNPDSDSDTFLDGNEVLASSDPLNPDSYTPDGDVNLDGEVNSGDLVTAQRIIMGDVIASIEQMHHADVAPLIGGIPNPDGLLTIGDLVVLTRKVLGLTNF